MTSYVLWATTKRLRRGVLSEEIVGVFASRVEARRASAELQARAWPQNVRVSVVISALEVGHVAWDEGFATIDSSEG